MNNSTSPLTTAQATTIGFTLVAVWFAHDQIRSPTQRSAEREVF